MTYHTEPMWMHVLTILALVISSATLVWQTSLPNRQDIRACAFAQGVKAGSMRLVDKDEYGEVFTYPHPTEAGIAACKRVGVRL